MLNIGTWNGKQVVANHHIDAIFNGIVDTHWSWTDLIDGHSPLKAKYAYQWHRCLFEVGTETIPFSHTWRNGGQFVFVIPSLEIVIVFTGISYGDIIKQKQPFNIMHQYLLLQLLRGEHGRVGGVSNLARLFYTELNAFIKFMGC